MRRTLLSLLVFICAVPAFALDRQPGAAYHARREALGKKAAGLIVLFAPLEPSDSNYQFRQDNDFYYLSGIAEPGVALLISPAADAQGQSPARTYQEILFLPPRNLRMEKYLGEKLGADNPDAPKLTGFDRVEDINRLPDIVAKLLAVGRPSLFTDVSSQGEPTPSTEALALLKRTNGFLSLQDIKPMIASLRVIKDAGEIALLHKAVDASVAAHLAAMKAMKPRPEYEISALMQYEWDRRGCERPSYAPIVGSGHNSTVLHYSENTNTMRSGDVVVIDAAAECSMYAADITRTLPVNGHFTSRQKEIYEIVLGAQEAAMAAFQSGKTFLAGPQESLDKAARDYIKTHGKDLHGQPLDQYFIHGLGHYIGLDVHDVGDYRIPLAPRMAFTIEPGIYIPEENIGVRIEDDFLVGEDGKLIKLSESLPSKPDEVEKVMTGK